MACCGCFSKKPKNNPAEPRPVALKKEASLTPGGSEVVQQYPVEEVKTGGAKQMKRTIQRAAVEL